MLLAIVCEKKAIPDPDGWEKSCNDHMEKYYYKSIYSWNQHNPTVRNHILHVNLALNIYIKLPNTCCTF